MKITRLICLGLLIFTTAVHAQQLGIEPFFGYRFGGEIKDLSTGTKYSFEDSPAYGLFLNWGPTNADLRVEFLWSRQDSSVNFHGDYGVGKVDLTIDEFQIGCSAETGTARFRQYVSAHVGATYFASDGHGDDTKFSIGIGVGGKVILTQHLFLFADFRGFCTIVDAGGGFIYSNGATVASFSGSTLWQGQVSAGVGVTF